MFKGSGFRWGVLMSVCSLLLVGSVSSADYGTKRHKGRWDERHPRQAEVNGRLQNQENRVKQGEADGALTKQEGKQINREDRAIYRQEQRMKRRNGGDYLTAGQQAKLNGEENKVSNQINADEAGNKPAGSGSTTTPTTPGN